MTKGRSLRYSGVADMPEGMRRLFEKKGAAVVIGVDMGRDEVHTEVHGLRQGGKTTITSVTETRRNKYGNQVTHVDGIRFDSKREAAYYAQLQLRKAAGEVSFWLRQVPVHLPGGTRYVLDFLVFYVDGRFPDFVDVKGRETKEFKIKKREVEHHYPFRVVLA